MRRSLGLFVVLLPQVALAGGYRPAIDDAIRSLAQVRRALQWAPADCRDGLRESTKQLADRLDDARDASTDGALSQLQATLTGMALVQLVAGCPSEVATPLAEVQSALARARRLNARDVDRRSPTGMTDSDFRALAQRVVEQPYGEEKLAAIAAVRSAWFTVQQVGELCDRVKEADEKVRVVELLAGRLVDRDRASALYSHFTHSDDKEKVKGLLARAQ